MGNRPLVTLLTDFGRRDPFVGILKGVMLGICPDAALVDLSHDIDAYDILGAGFLLQTAVPFFPPETVHLAIVDPGVGGARRPIAARIAGQLFVAPDNGLLSYALDAAAPEAIHLLAEPAYRRHPLSATFHGRDLFAPAAAYLASGLPLGRLGPAVRDVVRLRIPRPQQAADGQVWGEVIWVDGFGNCITSVTADDVAAATRGVPAVALVEGIADARFPVVRTYEEAGPGGEGALVGSSGRLELFARSGDFARRRGVSAGRRVALRRAGQADDPDGEEAT